MVKGVNEYKGGTMPELAYLNGKVMPISEALVPIEDRGYQFGDAVYEFIASYNGKLFCLEAHLDRLMRSLQGLDFPQVDRDGVRQAVLELFKQADLPRAGIYIQISRGTAPRDHAFPASAPLQTVMTIRPIIEKPPELRKNGAAAITVEDLRWALCELKTVQLLPNVMAKQKALEAGAFDAIFVSAEGVVREASSSNVFIVSGGAVVTHPLTRNILPGITRQVVLDICREQAIACEEQFYRVEDLYGADEAFLSGTTTEVLPIVTIDQRRIGDGRVGPVSSRLYQLLRERAGA
jgi:D-alanine transaminase